MNRMQKEEIRKHKETREGLSELEIKSLDQKEAREAEIESLARAIHVKEFSEEYDFQYDSGIDAKERSQGRNPMSQEYTNEMNKKRVSLGVSPLKANGHPVDDASWKLCLSKAQERFKEY